MQAIHYLHAITGTVLEVHLPYKAVLSFTYNGKKERALLKVEKLVVDGVYVPEGKTINEYVEEGNAMKFDCHGFDESKQDRCGWFVTKAWKKDVMYTGPISYFSGITNSSGKVTEISQRHGILTYTDASGNEHSVLFLASKLFLFGKRFSTKQKLESCLTQEETVQFDARPCDPRENESQAEWFATLVWKGKKPEEVDSSFPEEFDSPSKLLATIKQVAENPRSVFIRGQGQIMKILNSDYGIALGAVKKNHWQSILFHKSSCFGLKTNLSIYNLNDVFKEGERIRFIAAGAPKGFGSKWIASQISVYLPDDFEELDDI